MPYTDDTSPTDQIFDERRAVALRRYMDEAGFGYRDVLDALSRVARHDAHCDEENNEPDSAAFCRRVAQVADEARQRVEALMDEDV